MEIKTSDLPDLVGQVLAVQVNVVGSDDEDFREVSGKCIATSPAGIVIQTKQRSEIIKIADIIDLDIVPKTRRLLVRYVGELEEIAVRQHLLDRHGVPFALVKNMEAKIAAAMHDKIDHSQLGHRHEDKPRRGAGRPKKEETDHA